MKRLAGLVRFLPFPADERAVLRELFERIEATSKKEPPRTFTEEFTIVGVLREWDEKDRDSPGFRGFGDPDRRCRAPHPLRPPRSSCGAPG